MTETIAKKIVDGQQRKSRQIIAIIKMKTLVKIIDYLEEREISAYVLKKKINFWRIIRKLLEFFIN